MIKRLMLSVFMLGLLLLPALIPPTAQAAINTQMSFQGKLTNPDGTNVTDGTYSLRFRIYTDPTADTGACASTCKWEETQGSVSVSGGLFHVNLGSVTSLPGSVDFNGNALYLGVKVGTDAEMTPRVRLTAAPYAFNSDTLDGLDSSALGQLSVNQTWSGANVFQPTANTTALIVKQTSAGSPSADIFNVQTANATNVIQVTGPAANEAAVTISSIGATRALTLSSGSGAIILGASSLQRTASGTTTINLIDGANTLLSITNSGAGTASINTDGGYQIAGTPGATVTCSGGQFLQNQVVSGGLVTGGSCTDVSPTLQNVYANDSSGEADITTTSAAKTILVKAGSTFDSASLFHVQNAAGTNLFTVDSLNARIQIGSSTTDSTAALLVLDSYDISADPGGTNGAVYYNSADNDFRAYQNSRWANIQPVRYAYLSADRTSTSTTYANITDLGFAVDANTNYEIVCNIVYQSAATTTGIGISLNGPATPSLVVGQFIANSSATALNGRSFNAYNGGNKTTGVQTINANTYGIFRGYFRNGTTAGTLQLRFASEVNASQVTIKANSYCRLSEL